MSNYENNKKNMRILIINLPRYKDTSVTREGRCELILKYRVDTPTTLLMIASLVRKLNYTFIFIDANGQNITYKTISNFLKNKNFDIAIFTFNSKIIDHDLEICNIMKKINPSCITIGYSWYARNYGKQILENYKNLDIVLLDDIFSIIEDLLKSIMQNIDLINVKGIAFRANNNQIIITKLLDSRIKIDELPLPAYDLLKNFKSYYIYSPLFSPYALVYSGKGCPFDCTYCPTANTKYSRKSTTKIIEELKILKKSGKVKYIWFYDELFTFNRNKTMELCKNIIEEGLRVKWVCDSRVDLVDKQLLKIMRRAGCIGISYGVESGSQKILDLMNKRITVEQAKNALKWTRQANIPINLNIILGYIGENEETLKETEDFIRETLPPLIKISIIKAYENTKFTEIALKNKWINENLDWKSKLSLTYEKLTNYDPYRLNLRELEKSFRKIIYYNPKWWFHSLITLVRNVWLLLPIIGIFLRKSKSTSLI